MPRTRVCIRCRFRQTDNTFLPWPVLSTSGGATEFVSTRAAWRDLPETVKERTHNLVLRHRYGHSCRAISPAAARPDIVTMWPDTTWRAVGLYPVNGDEALYIASHALRGSA